MARWALWVAATDCRGAAACFWSFVAKQGRTLLDESDLEMVVILHINKTFMAYMKVNHPELVRTCTGRVGLLNQTAFPFFLGIDPGRPRQVIQASTQVDSALTLDPGQLPPLETGRPTEKQVDLASLKIKRKARTLGFYQRSWASV